MQAYEKQNGKEKVSARNPILTGNKKRKTRRHVINFSSREKCYSITILQKDTRDCVQ